MLSLYCFRDKKSGVLSNHFVTADPIEKVKQSVSISLLQTSFKEPTNPFILYSKDFDLIKLMDVDDLMSDDDLKEFLPDNHVVNFDVLLTASRSAYDSRYNHTSQEEELDKLEE